MFNFKSLKLFFLVFGLSPNLSATTESFVRWKQLPQAKTALIEFGGTAAEATYKMLSLHREPETFDNSNLAEVYGEDLACWMKAKNDRAEYLCSALFTGEPDPTQRMGIGLFRALRYKDYDRVSREVINVMEGPLKVGLYIPRLNADVARIDIEIEALVAKEIFGFLTNALKLPSSDAGFHMPTFDVNASGLACRKQGTGLEQTFSCQALIFGIAQVKIPGTENEWRKGIGVIARAGFLRAPRPLPSIGVGNGGKGTPLQNGTGTEKATP